MKPSWLVVLVALAAELVFAPIALADDEARAQAATKFREAEASFARGAYPASAEAFEGAASLAPHWSAWLNASEAWELAGEPLRAVIDCERALALPDLSDAGREEATRRVARMSAKLGRIELLGPSRLRAAIDGEPPVALPVLRWAMPGTHVVRVLDGDKERTTRVDVAPGERRTIELSAAPSSSPPVGPPSGAATPDASSPAREESFAPPAASWICFGVAGAGTVVTSAFGGLTVAAKARFDEAPSRDAAAAFHRDKLVTNVALAISAAAAAAGAVVWIVDAASPSTAVSITAGVEGPHFTLGARF